MNNVVFIFNSPKPILNTVEKVLNRYLPPSQYDSHIHLYNIIMRAYGGNTGYERRMAYLKAKKNRIIVEARS